jgi:hypothetical protein
MELIVQDPSHDIDCFNLQCNGFVQISNEYAFGAALTPLSQFGGAQYEISLTLYKVTKFNQSALSSLYIGDFVK